MKRIVLLAVLFFLPGSVFGQMWVGTPNINVRTQTVMVDHFIGGTTNDGAIGTQGWRRYSSNGGALEQWCIPSKNVIGSINLALYNNYLSAAAIYMNFSQFGNNENTSSIQFRVYSTSSDSVAMIIGFYDNVGVAPSVTDGVYFYVNTDQSSGKYWTINTVNNGVKTSSNTTFLLDTKWHWYRIELTTVDAKFYIDDNLVGIITTDIPSGDTRLFGAVVNAWNLSRLGTTKKIWIDEFEYKISFDKALK